MVGEIIGLAGGARTNSFKSGFKVNSSAASVTVGLKPDLCYTRVGVKVRHGQVQVQWCLSSDGVQAGLGTQQ
jgi:hypothetical protein